MELFDDNNIIIAQIYNSSPNDLVISKFNISQKQITNTFTIKNYEGIGFSHFAGFNWLCCSGNSVYFIKPLSYTMYELNENVCIVDSFKVDCFDNQQLVKISDSFVNEYKNRLMNIILSLMEFHKTKARILRFSAISSDSILVYRFTDKGASKRKLIIDLLIRKSGKWNIEPNYYNDHKPKLLAWLTKKDYPQYSYYSGKIKRRGRYCAYLFPSNTNIRLYGKPYLIYNIQNKLHWIIYNPIYSFVMLRDD